MKFCWNYQIQTKSEHFFQTQLPNAKPTRSHNLDSKYPSPNPRAPACLAFPCQSIESQCKWSGRTAVNCTRCLHASLVLNQLLELKPPARTDERRMKGLKNTQSHSLRTNIRDGGLFSWRWRAIWFSISDDKQKLFNKLRRKFFDDEKKRRKQKVLEKKLKCALALKNIKNRRKKVVKNVVKAINNKL